MHAMNQRSNWIFNLLLLVALAIGAYFMVKGFQSFQTSTQQAFQPLADANNALQTQVSDLLHPTPTVIPDPVTIIHEVQALARLETIQYTVEKVVTVEQGQGVFGFAFGDKILFVGHGIVIAGIDLQKIQPENLSLQNGVLYVTLPPAEIFIATLDNGKSYVYDRETGVLTHGNHDLETTARQAAEQQIRQAAIDDGILNIAQQNAESFLDKFFEQLGYADVIFLHP
jgi:hypothetical protein